MAEALPEMSKNSTQKSRFMELIIILNILMKLSARDAGAFRKHMDALRNRLRSLQALTASDECLTLLLA